MDALLCALESELLAPPPAPAPAPRSAEPAATPPPPPRASWTSLEKAQAAAAAAEEAREAAASTLCGEYWTTCEDCGVGTVPPAHGSGEAGQLVCPECGRLAEKPGDCDLAAFGSAAGAAAARRVPWLTAVGANRSRDQRELDKFTTVDTTAARYEDILKELQNYNIQYTRETHQRFAPNDYLFNEVAAEYVYETAPKSEGVMRAQNKQSVLAFLIYKICERNGQACTRAEAARFMQLRNGLARGESRVRTIGACRKMLQNDPDRSWVDTGFVRLGLVYRPHELRDCGFPTGELAIEFTADDGRLFDALKEAAVALLRAGAKCYVGIACIPQTRATGAIYAVLRRAALAGRLPPHWLIPAHPGAEARGAAGRGTLEWVATSCGIRPQTVKGFLRSLHDYHSQFEKVYLDHGLSAAKLEMA